MKDIFLDFLQGFFCKNYQINSIISSILGGFFLHFKDLVNKGQNLIFFIGTLFIRTPWWFSKYLDLWDSQDEFVI